MARARNIKPSFFTNEQLCDNEPLGRLLFIGFWTEADHLGNLSWKPRTLKVKLLPFDDCDIEKLAINLDKSGLIRFYSVQGEIYINIPNFERHQNPHKNEREKGSDIPQYADEHRQVIDLTGFAINLHKSGLKRNDSASDRADSLLLLPDSFSLKTESVPEKPEKKQTREQVALPDCVDPKVFADFLQIRKAKRAPLTNTALDGIRAEAIAAGISLNEALRICCERGWQGFRAEWCESLKSKATASKHTSHMGFDDKDYSAGVLEDGTII